MAEEDVLDLADSLHILNSGVHRKSDSLTEILRQHSAASQLQHASLDSDSLFFNNLQQTSKHDESCLLPPTPLPTQSFPGDGSDSQLSCYETEPSEDLAPRPTECLSCGDLSEDACLMQNDLAASKSQFKIHLLSTGQLSLTVPPVVSGNSREQPSVDVDAVLAVKTEVCQSQDGSTEVASMHSCKSHSLPDAFKVPGKDGWSDYRFPENVPTNQPASLETYEQSAQDELSFEDVIVSDSVLQASDCKTQRQLPAGKEASQNVSSSNLCRSYDLFSDHVAFDLEEFELEHDCKETVQFISGLDEQAQESIGGIATEAVFETLNYGSGDSFNQSPDVPLRVSAGQVTVNRDERALNLIRFSEAESPNEACHPDEDSTNPTPANLKDHTVSSWDRALLNFQKAFGTNPNTVESSSEGSDCELFNLTEAPVSKSNLSKQWSQCKQFLLKDCLRDSFQDILSFDAEGTTACAGPVDKTSEVANSADKHLAYKSSDANSQTDTPTLEKENFQVGDCGTCGPKSDQELPDIDDKLISLPSVDFLPSAVSASAGEVETQRDFSENETSPDQSRWTDSQLNTTNEGTALGPRHKEQTIQPDQCTTVTFPQGLLENLYQNLQAQFPPQVIFSYFLYQLQLLANHLLLMMTQIHAITSQLQNAFRQSLLSAETPSLANFLSPMSNMAVHLLLSQGLETSTLDHNSSEPDQMLEHKPGMTEAEVSTASDIFGNLSLIPNGPSLQQEESSGGTLNELSPTSPIDARSCDMANGFQDTRENIQGQEPRNGTEDDVNTSPTDWTQVFNSIWDVCTDDEMEHLFAEVRKKECDDSKAHLNLHNAPLVSDPASDSFVLSSTEVVTSEKNADTVEILPILSVPNNMNNTVSSPKRERSLDIRGNGAVTLGNGSVASHGPRSATNHPSTSGQIHGDKMFVDEDDDMIVCPCNHFSAESCDQDRISGNVFLTSTQVDAMENNAESVENRPTISVPPETKTTISSPKRGRSLVNQRESLTQFVTFRYGPRASRGPRSASNRASAKSCHQDKIFVEGQADPASDSFVRASPEVETEEKNAESEKARDTLVSSSRRERSLNDLGKSCTQTVKFRYGPRASRGSRYTSKCNSTKDSHPDETPLEGRDDTINSDATKLLGVGTKSMPEANSSRESSVSVVRVYCEPEPKEGSVHEDLWEERGSSEWNSSNGWGECSLHQDNVSTESKQMEDSPLQPEFRHCLVQGSGAKQIGDANITKQKDRAIASNSEETNLWIESSEYGIPEQTLEAPKPLSDPGTSNDIWHEIGPTSLASEGHSWPESYLHKTRVLPKEPDTRLKDNSVHEKHQCRWKSERGQRTTKTPSVNYRDSHCTVYPGWDNQQFAKRPFRRNTTAIFSSIPKDCEVGISYPKKPPPWKVPEPLWNCEDEIKFPVCSRERVKERKELWLEEESDRRAYPVKGDCTWRERGFASRSFRRNKTQRTCTDIPNLTDDDKLTRPAWRRPKIRFVPPRMQRRLEHKDFAE